MLSACARLIFAGVGFTAINYLLLVESKVLPMLLGDKT